jgi:gluconokinase
MRARTHFMKPEMLQSQFDTLEEPTDAEAFVVTIDDSVDRVVERIMRCITVS